MKDVSILLEEYLKYRGRTNTGLITGSTKQLRQGFKTIKTWQIGLVFDALQAIDSVAM